MTKFTYNPKSETIANSKDFDRYRREIENLPVTCDDGSIFDCDNDSIEDLQRSIDYWNDRDKSELDWKLKDNRIIKMDRSGIQNYFNEIKRKKAIRSFRVFDEMQALKLNPNTTLQDLENWKTQHQ